MFTAITSEHQESHQQYDPGVVTMEVEKREPMPQDIPFADLLSYGTNGSPTITMTKTLYSAGEVTSTTSGASASTSGTGQGTPNSPSLSLDAAPFVGVVVTSSATGSTQANSPSDGRPTTTASSTSAKTRSATASVNATSNEPLSKNQGGTIAGATLGSMAAFGMIGFLIWYCCAKKHGKRKMKFKLNIKRRKSSTAKTPQLEDQTMEETRKAMLDRAKNLNEFLKSPPEQSKYSSAAELPGDVGVKRNVSQTESSRTHASWIGVAVTSGTPPNTPPLPRSNSQKSTRTVQSTGNSPPAGHPTTLMPGFGSQQQHIPASLMPTPLKPAMRPAPIITSHGLARPENVSPLSPRGMFNAVSNTTTRVWRRASQALSPGAYQRVDDGPSGVGIPKRRDSKPRNPELEIGHQTDKNWNGGWI